MGGYTLTLVGRPVGVEVSNRKSSSEGDYEDVLQGKRPLLLSWSPLSLTSRMNSPSRIRLGRDAMRQAGTTW